MHSISDRFCAARRAAGRALARFFLLFCAIATFGSLWAAQPALAQSAPAILGHPSNSTISAGANTTFAITAALNATAYQWQVDSGAGFTNISNGGVYSGATTGTLTITGATVGMNGYQYRVVATGSVSPPATSNTATLTVLSNDATLSNLTISAGTLAPAFASGTNSYTADVPDSVDRLTVIPTVNQPNATLTMNGANVISDVGGSVSLLIGINTFIIVVTAQDGSANRTYTLAVTRAAPVPTLSSISPNAGPVAGGTPVTLGGTGFSGATAVHFGVVSATNFTVNSDTTITAVTPAHVAGTVDVAVTTSSGVTTNSRAYTYVDAPTARAVSETVAANSGANPITLNITGTATAVAVATQATKGTATALGTSIIYTPTPGYFGPDSFTYTATNAGGTSAPATVTITVSAPLAFTPAPGALPSGMVGTAYSQTITAAGGTAPYSYAVSQSSLPTDVSLDPTTGAITGTPTASGNFSFTVTAIDFLGASTTANYSIAISPPPATFTFSPSGGALAEAMAGEDYSQRITADGGAGAIVYSISSGALPAGMVLNISTGELTGPLAAATEGDYAFAIEARDGNGSTGTADYTLKVKSRAVVVADRIVDVPPGSTPNDVYLNDGATGGPFDSAEIVFVEPAAAGSATIIRGQLAQAGPIATPAGWYLKFAPNPAYSGKARVGFRLTSALGTSNTGTITYNLGYDAGEVARDVDAQVRGFVQSRQSMISSAIEIPGLLERRRIGGTADAVTTRMSPSQAGLALGFNTSLAQMQAAETRGAGAISPFNAWVDGAFLAHNRRQNDNDTESRWGSFAMVSLGADYLLSEKALVGLSVHYDRMSDPTDEDAKLTGNGWLAGPYASFEIGKGVFWDTSLLYGGSSNDIDMEFWDGTFDTRRWLFDSAIKGQWQLDDTTVLTPKLRAVYFSEEVDDYAVSNGSGDVIELDAFSQEQFRVSLGAEIARSFVLASGATLTPKLGMTGGFSGLDGSGLFGSVSTGLSLQTVNDWTVDAGLLFDIEGEGQKAIGAKVGVSTRF